MAVGCCHCLPISVVQLKGKHCRKPHCCNGVVDKFRPCLDLNFSEYRVVAAVAAHRFASASAVLFEVRRRKLQLCFHGFCRCVSRNSVVCTVSSFSKHLIGGKCPPPPTFPPKNKRGGGRGRRLR